MYPEIPIEHLSLVGLDVKSLGQKDEATKILSLREEDWEAGWYGVVGLWELKDAQGSVKPPGRRPFELALEDCGGPLTSWRKVVKVGGTLYMKAWRNMWFLRDHTKLFGFDPWIQWGTLQFDCMKHWLAGVMWRQETQEKLWFRNEGLIKGHSGRKKGMNTLLN